MKNIGMGLNPLLLVLDRGGILPVFNMSFN